MRADVLVFFPCICVCIPKHAHAYISYMYFFFLATDINLSYNSKGKMPRSALDFAFLRAYTCEITTSSNIPGSNITYANLQWIEFATILSYPKFRF